METVKDFFVASKIYDTSTFRSNDKIGTINHNVKVSKKKYLIYSTIDEKGIIRYYDYETGNYVQDQTINHSFTNEAHKNDVSYYSYMDNITMRKTNKMRTRFKKCETKYGFFMPLNDYIKMNIPFYNPVITCKFKAQAIVKFLNALNFGKIKLDNKEDIAHKQLEEIKCYKPKIKVNEKKKETYAKAA